MEGQEGKARAPYGFGAEVDRSLTVRREFLRHAGIDPDSPGLRFALDEIELRTLGTRLAKERGASLVPTAAGFRGRLDECGRCPSGGAYAVVVDDRTRRLAIVRGSAEVEALKGRQVELVPGSDGQVLVRRLGLGLER